MLGWKSVIEKEAFLKIIDNDLSFLDTVIALFEAQSVETVATMNTALDNEDWSAFERAAHDVKNIGRSVASASLVQCSRDLELIAARRQVETAADELENTTKLLTKGLKELKAIRTKIK